MGYNIWKLDLKNPKDPSLKLWTGRPTIGKDPDTGYLRYPTNLREFETLGKGFLTTKKPTSFIMGGYWGNNLLGQRVPFDTVLTKSVPKDYIIEAEKGYVSTALHLNEIIVKDDPCDICLDRKGRKILPIRDRNLLLCNKCYSMANRVSRKDMDLPDLETVYLSLGHKYGVQVGSHTYSLDTMIRNRPSYKD